MTTGWFRIVVVFAVGALVNGSCSSDKDSAALVQRLPGVEVTTSKAALIDSVESGAWPTSSDPALTGAASAVRAGAAVSVDPSTPSEGASMMFDIPPEADPSVAFVATRPTDDSEPWVPAEATADNANRKLTVHPPHFSDWGLFWIDVDKLFHGAFGGSATLGGAAVPECADRPAGASVSVTAAVSNGDPVLVGCVGVEGGVTVVKLANTTSVALGADRPAGVDVVLPPADDLWSSVIKQLNDVSGNKRVIIPPNTVATLRLADPTQPVSLLFGPDPGAYLLEGFWDAVSLWSALFNPSNPMGPVKAAIDSAEGVAFAKSIGECVATIKNDLVAAVGNCGRSAFDGASKMVKIAMTNAFAVPLAAVLVLADLSRLAVDGATGLVRAGLPRTVSYTPAPAGPRPGQDSGSGPASPTTKPDTALPATFDQATEGQSPECGMSFTWHGKKSDYIVKGRRPMSGLRIYAASGGPTCVQFQPEGNYHHLTATIANDDRDPTDLDFNVSILLDGEVVKTVSLKHHEPQQLEIDLTGTDTLRINVDCVGRCNYYNVTTAGPILFDETLS